MISFTPSTNPPIRQRRTWLRMILACALLASLAGPALTSEAAPTALTWYVSTSGNDDNTCLSAAAACRNIGRAIDKAESGDTIMIAAGTFIENLDVFESLTLQGAGAGNTIIDGAGLGSTLTIAGGASVVVNLNALTLQNGASNYGAGLYISAGIVNASAVEIIDNDATQGGAGVFNQGQLSLTNVGIKSNTNAGQDRGGGLLNLGSANLVNVTVSDNAGSFGSGLGNRGVMTITSSTINHNLNASLGGGIANDLNGRLTLANTTISNHPAGGGLHNAESGVVVMSGGVITNNWSDTGGGGIYSLGQLTLGNVGIYNNRANSSFGGGVFNGGIATLNTVIIQGNLASSGSGGGIHTVNANSSLTLNNSVIRENQTTNGNGGGLNVAGGSLTIAGAVIISNTSDSLGGGLYNATATTLNNVDLIGNSGANGGGGLYNGLTGNLTYQSGNLRGNTSATGNGGGLNNTAHAELTNLTINGNQASNSGGGLYNGLTGHLSVINSSLYDNGAQQSSGGGIDNRGQLQLTASSIYSNTTVTQGGSGLYNAASAQLINSTLSYNRALNIADGGALLNNGGTFAITNTTLSANYGPSIVRTSGTVTLINSVLGAPADGGNNCVGTLVSLGHNLDSGNSCGFTATGDITNADPLLGALQNNGGPTPTRGLTGSSPALDAGNDAQCPGADQRGVVRPQGTSCDIGAYEVIGFSTSVTQTVGAQLCVTSTLSLSNSYSIAELNVGANITFEPRGNLRVNLHSPGGLIIHLLGNTGGNGQNLDVRWDDASPFGPVGTEDHILDSSFYKYVRVPDESLGLLTGRRLTGDWKLEVCNVADTGSGTLNRWSLIVPSFGNPKVYLPLIRR